MGRAFPAFLLVVAALAGCADDGTVGGGAADGGTSPDPGATLNGAPSWTELRFEGCRHQLGFFPVDVGEAEARVPAGFTPIGNVPGKADILVLTTSCDRLVADGQPSLEALSGILVEPPAGQEKPGADLHFVYTSLRTGSAAAASAYASWGLEAALGGVAITDGDGLPAATAEATFGTATVRTTVGGEPSEGPSGSVRGYVAEGEAVRLAIDFEFPGYLIQSGTGVLQDPQGVTGFAVDALAGLGYQEFGDGYGITLTPVTPPPA